MAVDNSARYAAVFTALFGLSGKDLEALAYRTVPAWDSARHMELVAALESEFGIFLEPDDILDFSSYMKGREILSQKYGVDC